MLEEKYWSYPMVDNHSHRSVKIFIECQFLSWTPPRWSKLGTMKRDQNKRQNLSPKQSEEIATENIELVLELSLVRFNDLREDKKINQSKAQFILVLLAVKIALLITAAMTLDAGESEQPFILIETIASCLVAALIGKMCFLPSPWSLGGVYVSQAWPSEAYRRLTPKAFKVFIAESYEERNHYNITNNEKAVTRLKTLSLVALLTPVISGLVAFLVGILV